jgi:hypothetical protein
MTPGQEHPPTITPGGPLALIVTPEGAATLTPLPQNPAAMLTALNEAVGGYLTAVGTREGWVAYINEDGKGLGLPPNFQADLLARALGFPFRHGDYLVGTAVFLGRNGVNETSVPDTVLTLARQIGLIPNPRGATP